MFNLHLNPAPLLLALIFVSNCSWIQVKPVPIDVPVGPAIAACPEKPELVGKVSQDGKFVVLTAETAQRLAVWVHDYTICTRSNEAEYQGYIEKLVNRIKSVNGGK